MSIDDEIARFDWSHIQTYLGHAEMVPDALRRLIAAPDGAAAARLGDRIEHILLSVAGPCEGCAPVATVLVAALPEMTPAGHSAALGLLSNIAVAEVTGPAHEQLGAVDAEQIRRAVAGGFQHYTAVLRAESSSEAELRACIDLLDISALHDRSLAAAAVTALGALRASGRAAGLAVAIDDALAELAEPAG